MGPSSLLDEDGVVMAGLKIFVEDGVEGLVDLTFCRSARRWPFVVARDLGRCLRTILTVRPGQVDKYPHLDSLCPSGDDRTASAEMEVLEKVALVVHVVRVERNVAHLVRGRGEGELFEGR